MKLLLMPKGWFLGEIHFNTKPAIPYSFLLSFIQGPSMTLGMPPLGLTIQGPMGFLKASLIQSISPRDLDIYHLYGRSISFITSHTIKKKNFSNSFQTKKHLLIVSGNACTLKQNTQCLQLKDSITLFFAS